MRATWIRAKGQGASPGTRRRRLIGAALAVVAAVGLTTASAAQLGVGGTTLAAGSAAVGDCLDGVTPVASLASTWSGGAYVTTGVSVSGIPPECGNKQYRSSLVDDDGDQLAEVTGTVPAVGGSVGGSFSGIPTASIVDAKIVIHT